MALESSDCCSSQQRPVPQITSAPLNSTTKVLSKVIIAQKQEETKILGCKAWGRDSKLDDGIFLLFGEGLESYTKKCNVQRAYHMRVVRVNITNAKDYMA